MRIEMYGALRDKFGDHVETDARTVKEVLAALPPGTALATEDRVLSPDEPLPKEGRLAALPPVCGG